MMTKNQLEGSGHLTMKTERSFPEQSLCHDYSKQVIDRKTKLKKLECGKKLLEWLARKSDSELYTTSRSIKGFKKISMVDLQCIVGN